MQKLDDFAKDYLTLGLRINKHIDGYVEHYYGPPELKKMVNNEDEKSPKNLFNDYKSLASRLPDQGFETHRQEFLRKTLNAIEMVLRKLNGENIPYLELVEGFFDFKPVLYDDDFFYNLTEKAEEVYKGIGTLSERIMDYANRRIIPANKLMELTQKAFKIAQKRTKEVFKYLLPNNEKIDIKKVENQPWKMYCWYQGDYTSNVEINVDALHYWTHLLKDACHEAYPGHHMERLLKECNLFNAKGYFESSILLIYTPEMVISEGIGLLAESIIFEEEESVKILLDDLYPFSYEEDDIEILIKQKEIREGFKRFEGNLAFYKYVYGWTNNELAKYAESFRVISKIGIKHSINLISDDIWGPYILCYQGERLIRERCGKKPKPSQFQKLLMEQNFPSGL